MKFTKMQGAGNDYVYVNCFAEKVENPAEIAGKFPTASVSVPMDSFSLCPPKSRCEDAMFNSDGSESEMCGNGIRW
jgi:diaminopimelate epimerase